MQPVKFLKFLRQFVVLVERNLQLIWNDKLLLASLTLQSPFMVLVVKLTADPNCFTSNLVNIGSRTALFVLAAMATFMGTLNSYREICREREIILREASVGVSLPAVVLSKAAVLLLVEVLQAAILAFGFVSIVHVPQNHLLLETDMEIFITVLLTMFSSSCIGLLISALFTSGESAILAVLVLMIGQVVFSNIMFTVTGAAATISNIIVCRWGMGALGASTDLNSRMAWLQAGLDGPMYDATVENLTHSWQMLGLISVVCLFTSGESAILAVLVLMIGQVVFSNIMFTVTGAAATISNIIVCRWGMGALGASTDLNSRMAWLQAGLDGPMYDATVENLTHSWQMLGLISVVCLVAAWLVLQIAFDKKKV